MNSVSMQWSSCGEPSQGTVRIHLGSTHVYSRPLHLNELPVDLKWVVDMACTETSHVVMEGSRDKMVLWIAAGRTEYVGGYEADMEPVGLHHTEFQSGDARKPSFLITAIESSKIRKSTPINHKNSTLFLSLHLIDRDRHRLARIPAKDTYPMHARTWLVANAGDDDKDPVSGAQIGMRPAMGQIWAGYDAGHSGYDPDMC